MTSNTTTTPGTSAIGTTGGGGGNTARRRDEHRRRHDQRRRHERRRRDGHAPTISSVADVSAASEGVLGSTTLGRGPGLPAPAIVRLRDVGRVELGALNYTQSCTFDGRPSVGLSVYQLPGTNALDVANAVRKKMKELKTRFPDDVDYEIGYDTTPFIRESVKDVVTRCWRPWPWSASWCWSSFRTGGP